MSQAAHPNNRSNREFYQPRRVVITGMGTLNPLAHSLEEFWEKLAKGQSGIERISAFDPAGYPSQVAGEVRGFEPKEYIEGKAIKRMSRVSQLAVAGAKLALADASLNIPAGEAGDYGII